MRMDVDKLVSATNSTFYIGCHGDMYMIDITVSKVATNEASCDAEL